MEDPTRSRLRLLAPLALAVFAVAFFAIVAGSNVGDERPSPRVAAPRPPQERDVIPSDERETPPAGGREDAPAAYTVKAGDTLGGIAAKTGVSLSRIQELNPDLDPQALVSGQKIKLRP